jgi:hypothetical protein
MHGAWGPVQIKDKFWPNVALRVGLAGHRAGKVTDCLTGRCRPKAVVRDLQLRSRFSQRLLQFRDEFLDFAFAEI